MCNFCELVSGLGLMSYRDIEVYREHLRQSHGLKDEVPV
jgi:hypothetical protein